MAAFIDLRPGLQLNVTPGRCAGGVSYRVAIRQVSKRGIHVGRPRDNGDWLELGPGDEITLSLQLHTRMYTCSSRVLEVQEVPVESMLIEHPVEVRSGERRQFYRLLTSIEPRYAARTNVEGDELERLEVRIVDISGGGLQLRVARWLAIGSRVRLIFALERDPLAIDVTVLALAAQRPAVRSSFYRVNAQFTEVEREVQERIIRFIFRQQLLLRQKQAI